jgi:hypothetical protein
MHSTTLCLKSIGKTQSVLETLLDRHVLLTSWLYARLCHNRHFLLYRIVIFVITLASRFASRSPADLSLPGSSIGLHQPIAFVSLRRTQTLPVFYFSIGTSESKKDTVKMSIHDVT